MSAPGPVRPTLSLNPMRTPSQHLRDQVEDVRNGLLDLQQKMDIELDPSSDLYKSLRALIVKLQAIVDGTR